MKKFFFTLSILSVFAVGVQAQILSKLQPVKFGVKAGVSVMSLNVNSISSAIFDADANAGYHIGLQARVTLSSLFIQPEIIYTSSKTKYELTQYGDRYAESHRINTIDVPIMIGYTRSLFRVGAGVVLTLYDNKDGELFNERMPFAKESVASYMIGAGVDIMSITLDARYVGNFNGSKQSIYADGNRYSSSIRRGYYQLSVGYMF